MLRTETVSPGTLELLSAIERTEVASLEDIAAKKLNAIIGNGTRLKDFVDIAFLSSHLSLREMTSAFVQKYKTRNSVMTIKALAYHNDIDFSEPISFIKGSYKWPSIAHMLEMMIKHQDEVFKMEPF